MYADGNNVVIVCDSGIVTKCSDQIPSETMCKVELGAWGATVMTTRMKEIHSNYIRDVRYELVTSRIWEEKLSSLNVDEELQLTELELLEKIEDRLEFFVKRVSSFNLEVKEYLIYAKDFKEVLLTFSRIESGSSLSNSLVAAHEKRLKK